MDTFVQRNSGIWPTIVLVAVLLVSAGCGKAEQSQATPPEVGVVKVEQKDVPISKEWIGTLGWFC